jgi:hypothetical protein
MRYLASAPRGAEDVPARAALLLPVEREAGVSGIRVGLQDEAEREDEDAEDDAHPTLAGEEGVLACDGAEVVRRAMGLLVQVGGAGVAAGWR